MISRCAHSAYYALNTHNRQCVFRIYGCRICTEPFDLGMLYSIRHGCDRDDLPRDPLWLGARSFSVL